MKGIATRLTEEIVEELGTAITKACGQHGIPKTSPLPGTVLRSVLTVMEQRHLIVLGAIKEPPKA